MLLERADLLVWLDLPRRTAMRQLVARTLRRRARREELWNGNSEPSLWRIFTDRNHIVRYAWNAYPRASLRVQEVAATQPERVIVRLRNRAELAGWVAGPLTQAALADQV